MAKAGCLPSASRRKLIQDLSSLRSVSNTTPDIIARFDDQFRHLFVSKSIETYTHLRPLAFIGKTHRELGMERELCSLWEAQMNRVFLFNRESRFEFSLPTSKGETFFETRMVPERLHKGKVKTVLCISRDITQQKKNEEDLRQALCEAERNAKTVTKLLNVLKNGITEPLHGLLNELDSSIDHTLAGRLLHQLQSARSSARHILETVNETVENYRLEEGTFEVSKCPFNLREMAKTCIIMLRHLSEKSDTEIALDIDPDAPTHIITDPVKLTQCLSNLIINAVKVSAGRKVSVRILNSSVKKQGPQIRFEIDDFGLGQIPSEAKAISLDDHRKKALYTFQGNASDIGLELSITHELIVTLGGRLGAFHREPTGATYWFEIPVDIVKTKSSWLDEQKVKHSGLSILLVEQGKELIAELPSKLQELSANLTHVRTREEAIHALATQEFRLIFVDTSISSENAFEITERIRSLDKLLGHRTPIIGIGSKDAQKNIPHINTLLDSYIPPQIGKEALVSKVKRWLN